MGTAHAHAARRDALAVILMATLALLIVLAVMAVGASIATQDAQAQSTFTACASCHNYTSSGDTFHTRPTHSVTACTKCHPGGAGTAVSTASCATAGCHGTAGAIIAARPSHVSAGCGTTAGCHGVPAPTPTPTPTATVVATTVTAKVAPTSIKLRKTVKVSGAVTPVATLAGKKVALRVDFKKGAKWIKTKTANATVTSMGTYSWKYKPLKKGTFRVKASIAATATYKSSKTAYKTFKVK